MPARPNEPRFPRPKVICIDLPDAEVDVVEAAGYRTARGTLGRPFRVARADNHWPVRAQATLPGLTEQEIVVLQHVSPEPADEPPEGARDLFGDAGIWASYKAGVIDARPYVAQLIRSRVERILGHGGLVICFCEPRVDRGLFLGRRLQPAILGRYGDLPWSPWDIVGDLESFDVSSDHGSEITVDDRVELFRPLASQLANARFSCTFEPGHLEDRWVPLAKNKYGADVAGVLAPSEEGAGVVILLPQVDGPGEFLRVLLNDVLPALAPKLFPDSQAFAWCHVSPYELLGVEDLEGQIATVRAEADEREAVLRARVESVRKSDGWLHDLLTATGDELVVAVEKALRELGLDGVGKTDDEAEERRTGRRREDLQVHARDSVMLVEVKGLRNLPTEANSLQVTKYLVPRMKEWNRVDVRGLSVINHQRALPPLERENVKPFQQDVLANAEENDFGLVTTYDLFRFILGKRRWGWPDDVVAPRLYARGRVEPLPTHYELVGVVDGFFEAPGVVTIQVNERGFNAGETLAFELRDGVVEEQTTTIQLDGATIETAEAGQRVGLKSRLTKSQAKTGVRVFRAVLPAELKDETADEKKN